MADKTGVARLRQAIENQYAAGEACFSLPIGETAAICDECEDELARLSWAKGVPVPVDADDNVVPLGTDELFTDKGEMVLVVRITFNGSSWHVWNSGGVYRLGMLHINRPDSWERLEEDVNLGCRDYCERYRLEECEYNVRVHMLERAKALAGRGAEASTPQLSPHVAKEADRA